MNKIEEFEDIDEHSEPQHAYFPIIMFGFAVIKDFVLDPIVLGFTVIMPILGWMLGVIIGIFFGITLWLWLLNKSTFIQRMMTRRFVRYILAAVIINFIPGVRFIIPEFIIIILLTYYREKKIVHKFNKHLESQGAFI